MANVMAIVEAMAAGALGAVIVNEFVKAANLSGSAATIAGLFTFILVGAVALYALSGGFGRK
jgi:hypothetical protein